VSPAGGRAAWFRRNGPAILAVAGLLIAGVAVVLSVRARRQNVAEASARAERTAQLPPYDPSSVELPAFSPKLSSTVLTRKTEPDTETPRRARVEVLRYTVQGGDSVFGIAKRFDLKPETVLWGNFDTLADDPEMLKPGQELNILPVNGTYYQWKGGDSLQSVGDFFGVEPSSIVDWPGNNLDPENPVIEPGTWLVIPDGVRAFRTWLVPTIARGAAGVGTAFGPGGCTGDYSGGAVGTGGFIWPTANHYLSGNDYWSGHLGIDIAAGAGATIWAADSGVVVFAGWSNGGYGNLVMLDHGNGWQTVYAHLSSVRVSCGQSVSQGQTIGAAGSTGNSTGAHLHFETRSNGGFVNPWFVLP
jgi:murein DD-endopeptidase MepM/ murein hydrolase activator NlpD